MKNHTFHELATLCLILPPKKLKSCCPISMFFFGQTETERVSSKFCAGTKKGQFCHSLNKSAKTLRHKIDCADKKKSGERKVQPPLFFVPFPLIVR